MCKLAVFIDNCPAAEEVGDNIALETGFFNNTGKFTKEWGNSILIETAAHNIYRHLAEYLFLSTGVKNNNKIITGVMLKLNDKML